MAGKKRGNGEGSISQHPDGRWWARLVLSNGKRKAFYGKSRKEVQQKLTAALSDQQKGLPIVNDRQTMAEFLTRWLEDTARHRLRPGTFRRYRELVQLHTLPTLGRLPLSKLSPQHLSHLYGEKLASNLSPRTVEF